MEQSSAVTSTLVSFHAHPDDEAIATGGTLARAAAEGHRTVLVFATRGELGEVADGFLSDGETLWERRVVEVQAAAEVLGVSRVEFLGYHDSGMWGEATNDDPACFWQADVDEAAARLAAILEEEGGGALTVYDDNGGYGHPDHIQIHRVGVRAAEMTPGWDVFEATHNRDYVRRLIEGAPPELRPPDFDPDGLSEFGVPEDLITTVVDVTDFVQQKRAAMRAHASQIPGDSFFLTMPDDFFAVSFGFEWYIHRGASEPRRDWLFA